MDVDTLLGVVQPALAGPLPGVNAHDLMAPRPPRAWPPGFTIDKLRHAAGLLLIVPRKHRAHVVLTLRASTLDRHSGQVSLPGGVIEPGESQEQTALREAHEEIGLSVPDVRVLGALTPLDIAVSGFRLHPIVGVARTRPHFLPALGEVDRVLEVPVADLLAPHRVVWRTTLREGRTTNIPVFPHDDIEIWGATAMALAEFLVLLGWAGPDPVALD